MTVLAVLLVVAIANVLLWRHEARRQRMVAALAEEWRQEVTLRRRAARRGAT